MKKLITQMIEDLRDCAKDPHGPHRPEFYESRNALAGKNWSVTVIYSRDPSRSNNGGEYYEDRRYYIGPSGSVCSYLISSCDSSDETDWTDHGVVLSFRGLERALELAACRVMAEMAPPPVEDIKKIRRRVEDALRKTAAAEDVLAVAGLLSVKID